MISERLLKEQIALEEEQTIAGINRYRKETNSRELSCTIPGSILLRRILPPMIDSFQKWLYPSNKTSLRFGIAKTIRDYITAEELAYITIKTVLDSLTVAKEQHQVTQAIGRHIIEHIEYNRFKRANKNLLAKVLSNLEHSTAPHKKRVILRAKRMVAEIEDLPLSHLEVGAVCFSCFKSNTNITTVRTFRFRRRIVTEVVPTEELIKFIEETHTKLEIRETFFFPMVIPPLDWQKGGEYSGGYLSNIETKKVPMIKISDKKTLSKVVANTDETVLNSLNLIQSTPWKINTYILDILSYLKDNALTLGGLPVSKPVELPPKPWQSEEEFKELKEKDPEIIKRWKSLARDTYDLEASLTSKRIALANKLYIADKFKNYPAIYFPHNLDWRGRVYPISLYLSPQGDDVAKALLKFSEAKTVTKDKNDKWFLIHGANCFGVDKVSFEDRINWVKDNAVSIIKSAAEPLTNRFWEDADEPFSFLAWAEEFKTYYKTGSVDSAIPIQMDGSCNGLQNFAAMLRDEIGGESVNLMAKDKPSDVYQLVADKVIELMRDDFKLGVEEAILWQGKVTRSVVKRNVMTTPYGVTEWGMKDQLIDYLKKENIAGNTIIPLDKLYKCSLYLAKLIWQAIGKQLRASREVMEWLQDIADKAAEENKSLVWKTPSGFYTYQSYKKTIATKIRSAFHGSIEYRKYTDSDKLDKKKQKAAISPNFVHSMDASHLCLTVLKANQCYDINNFSMIHDSYGTHAVDAYKLHDCLKEVFVAMYSKHDVLTDFYEKYKGFDIATPPQKGKLDLNSVLESKYFFA